MPTPGLPQDTGELAPVTGEQPGEGSTLATTEDARPAGAGPLANTVLLLLGVVFVVAGVMTWLAGGHLATALPFGIIAIAFLLLFWVRVAEARDRAMRARPLRH